MITFLVFLLFLFLGYVAVRYLFDHLPGWPVWKFLYLTVVLDLAVFARWVKLKLAWHRRPKSYDWDAGLKDL